MLAAASIQDYINPIKYAWPQLPAILVLFVGWIIGGAYLLRRNLKTQPKLVKKRTSWYCLVMFLAGLAAAAVGGVIVYMFSAISKAAEMPFFMIAGAVIGLLLAVAAVYLVIYAMADLPMPVVIRAGTLPLVVNVILIAIVALVCLLRVREIRSFEGHKNACQTNISRIAVALLPFDTNPDKLPANLDDLASAGKLPDEDTHCPTISKTKTSYFYMPVPAPKKLSTEKNAPAPRVRLCDFPANHDGEGRNVLFTSGTVLWYNENDFQKLMQQPENAEFAAALAAFEAGRPLPKPASPATKPATMPARNLK